MQLSFLVTATLWYISLSLYLYVHVKINACANFCINSKLIIIILQWLLPPTPTAVAVATLHRLALISRATDWLAVCTAYVWVSYTYIYIANMAAKNVAEAFLHTHPHTQLAEITFSGENNRSSLVAKRNPTLINFAHNEILNYSSPSIYIYVLWISVRVCVCLSS